MALVTIYSSVIPRDGLGANGTFGSILLTQQFLSPMEYAKLYS